MIDCCNDSDYIKSDIVESSGCLAKYLAYLQKEKSAKSAANEMSVLRRCLAVIGKDAEGISEEDMERLKESFSHLSERSLDTYVGIVRRYVYFCTGRGQEYVKGRLTYSAEMRRLSDKLKRDGMTAHTASENVSKVTAALGILREHGLPTSPGDITEGTMRELDRIMSDRPRKERLGYLRPLGWYVLANTGSNPYQGFIGNAYEYRRRNVRTCRFETDLAEFRAHLDDFDLSDRRRDTIVSSARKTLNRMDDMFGTDYTIESITKQQLVRFRRETKDLKESTRREYLQALGMLIEFKTGNNLVQLCRFRFTKMDQKRTFISEGEVRRMYENADSEERLMLAMGISEAMRRGEIGNMRYSNMRDGNFEFWSKGFGPEGKYSVLPIMDDVKAALDAYRGKRERIVEKWGESDPDAILLNSYGRPMSPDVVYKRLKNLADRSGVEEFTPHSLRRFAATRMRREGAEISDIACALRHEDPVTTIKCYLKDDPEVKAITLAKATRNLFAG